MAENDYVLEFRDITKKFTGVTALENVSFGIRRGTVHVIVGENGAGKSTLMKIISGAHQATSGSMILDGVPVSFATPNQAREAGVTMIYQELQYVPMFTVEQFMMMGREPRSRIKGCVDWKEVRRRTVDILEKEGLKYAPDTVIRTLSVSDIQMLETARAVSANSKIIIMDEPTSALTQGETERLFANIDRLRDNGVTILYISHKMDEVFRVADDITILRDGHHISTQPASTLDVNSIIHMMVGREVNNIYPYEERPLGDEILRIENFSTKWTGVRDISFYARKGEILGIAGLVGAGRTELLSALVGLDDAESGTVTIDGKKAVIRTLADSIKCGMFLATEDRRRQGFVGCRSVKENIALPNLKKFSRFGVLNDKKEEKAVVQMRERLKIKISSLEMLTEKLSGGNQQKVVLAKWILAEPKILILDDPTRGIDVGAKYEIYKLMNEMAQEGITIIMTSSETPEILGMCDRIYTMYNRRITGEIQRGDFSQELVMKYITGGN